MGVLSLAGNRSKKLLSRITDTGRDRERTYTIVREKWFPNNGDLNDLPRDIGDLPFVKGQGLTSAAARFEDSVVTYEWKFETVEGKSSSSGSSQIVGTGPIISFEGSLNKTPITMHRDFGQWMGYRSPEGKKYGRVVEGEVQWELEDPNQSSGRRGLDPATQATVSNLNPFYGVKDFYDVSALHIVEEEYSKAELRNVLQGIGEIQVPVMLTGDEGSSGQNRNWLYVGADASQVGNKFWVRRTWMLSGFGQWEPAIYDPNYFAS